MLLAASMSPAFRTGIEAIRTNQKATVKVTGQISKLKDIVAKRTQELQAELPDGAAPNMPEKPEPTDPKEDEKAAVKQQAALDNTLGK